jgi:hypothetical protein
MDQEHHTVHITIDRKPKVSQIQRRELRYTRSGKCATGMTCSVKFTDVAMTNSSLRMPIPVERRRSFL